MPSKGGAVVAGGIAKRRLNAFDGVVLTGAAVNVIVVGGLFFHWLMS
jgi:hypothetical protein